MTQGVWLPATVTARFESDGQVRPLHLRAAGIDHTVSDQGRSWRMGGDSATTHVLIRTADGRAFELRLDHETLRWSARPVEPPARPA